MIRQFYYYQKCQFQTFVQSVFPKIEATNFNKTRVVTTLRDNVESIRFLPVNENVEFLKIQLHEKLHPSVTSILDVTNCDELWRYFR